jgi:phage/plasmid-associated DNA primase
MGETNFGVLDKSSMLKKLTGGDMIGFEKKGKDPFNDYSYAKLIIASNSLPSSNDTSEGFYRRWFIIDFPNQFCEGKDILQDIPEQEYNNLARKCMDILPELLAKGSFDKQGSTEERKTKYILSSNPLPYFIDMCCIKDAHNYISYNELYTNYVTFLNANKRRIVKLKEFKEALIQEGLFVEKTSKKINDEFVSGYFVMGLRIKDDFMTIMTIMTRNHTPKFSFVGELKKQSQLSQLSQKCLDFEEKVVSNFDKRQIIHIKCNIVECNSKECNLDSTETPYCQEHWEDNAL